MTTTFLTAIIIESDLEPFFDLRFDAEPVRTPFISNLIIARKSTRNREMRKETGASKMTWT